MHDALKVIKKNCDTSKVKLLKKSILLSDTLPRLNLKMILSALLGAQSLKKYTLKTEFKKTPTKK